MRENTDEKNSAFEQFSPTVNLSHHFILANFINQDITWNSETVLYKKRCNKFRPVTFLKKRLRHNWFRVNFSIFLTTILLHNNLDDCTKTSGNFEKQQHQGDYSDTLVSNNIDLSCFYDRAPLTRMSLREKCPNTEFFLTRIFPHSDQKNFVLGHFSRSVFFKTFSENIW